MLFFSAPIFVFLVPSNVTLVKIATTLGAETVLSSERLGWVLAAARNHVVF